MKEIAGSLDGQGQRIGIVVSRFNEPITNILHRESIKTLKEQGVAEANITVASVPGAFEVPFLGMTMARTGAYDAIICLGAVIRGETPHFDFVAKEAASGVAQIAMTCGVPAIFGVLTTDTVTQAIERAASKGIYSAKAAVEMVNLTRSVATDQTSVLSLQSVCTAR